MAPQRYILLTWHAAFVMPSIALYDNVVQLPQWRRIKTVMQELMYLAARLVNTGRRLRLVFSRYCSAFEAFPGADTRVACT